MSLTRTKNNPSCRVFKDIGGTGTLGKGSKILYVYDEEIKRELNPVDYASEYPKGISVRKDWEGLAQCYIMGLHQENEARLNMFMKVQTKLVQVTKLGSQSGAQ